MIDNSNSISSFENVIFYSAIVLIGFMLYDLGSRLLKKLISSDEPKKKIKRKR
jgi:hypothetical protein